MATLGYVIGGCSQAGKTRKCNSGRLSGYDISGSYSICSQTLKWRLAWHGGRKVTTVSSLPVNPTPLLWRKRYDGGEERRGEEGQQKYYNGKNIYLYTDNITKKGAAKNKQDLNGVGEYLKGKVAVMPRDRGTMALS